MGILRRLGLASDQLALATTFESPMTSEAFASSAPVLAAAFGMATDSCTVTREQAMRIPGVRRGRQVICGTIGVLPLLARRTNSDGTVDDVTADRPVLSTLNPDTTPQFTLTWTVDDLLFYGVAWWRVTSRDAQGFPSRVEWLARWRITVDLSRQAVYVDGTKVDQADLIRFDGPDEGVLNYGGPTLTTTRLLEDAVRRFARLDIPLGILKLAEGASELSQVAGSCGIEGDDRSEVDYALDQWEAARRDRTTAFLNRALDYAPQQFDASQLQLADGRNFQLADVARLMNLAPRHVNAPAGDSLTYSTTEADRRDLLDTSLVGFIAAIEQRLSMNDFSPRGTLVHLDVTGLLRGDTKNALDAAKVAVDLGAMDANEVRVDVLRLAPRKAGA